MPEIRNTLIIGNAGLVDKTLLDLPEKSDSSELVLGHMSNLYLEKGLAEVIDLAIALHQRGTRIRLIIGGPTVEKDSRLHLDRAARELGELFEYRGPISGEAKHAFFEAVTHFVFPSDYVHESVPLVLYEAMAAGAVCVATRRGSISEQLEGSPSVLAASKATFVAEALPILMGASASAVAAQESRKAYLRALLDSERQLAEFVRLLSARQGLSAGSNARYVDPGSSK